MLFCYIHILYHIQLIHSYTLHTAVPKRISSCLIGSLVPRVIAVGGVPDNIAALDSPGTLILKTVVPLDYLHPLGVIPLQDIKPFIWGHFGDISTLMPEIPREVLVVFGPGTSKVSVPLGLLLFRWMKSPAA